MTLKIAWRNIWRNKLRSLIVMTAIALGIWAGLATMSFSVGMNNARTRLAINTYISHLQIHSNAYKKENKVGHYLPNAGQVKALIQDNDSIQAFSMRTLSSGVANSASGMQGVQIMGVVPGQEAAVSTINEKVVEGGFFENTRRNPVIVGKKLADKFKLKINSKLVLTFQDRDNNVTSSVFRVNGIFNTASTKYDESTVFVHRDDLQKLLGQQGMVHEVAIMLRNGEQVNGVQQVLQAALPELKVENWAEVSPDLGYADEMMAQSLYIFIGIILLAMAFGIINTMLMAVLERRRELGMLMSIGMNKLKVFGMIVYETIMIALIGGPLGILLALGTIQYFSQQGLDLSSMSEGMESFGMDPVVYPELESAFYGSVGVMVVIMAVLSAIYPAIKATKLKPTESMRTV